MKHTLAILIVFAVACNPGEEVNPVKEEALLEQQALSPLPKPLKGYELYSWQDTNGADWKHTLITGTNRLKTYNEIVAEANTEGTFVKITVRGTVELKALLSRLSAQTDVHWSARSSLLTGFALPSAEVIEEVKEHCTKINVNLMVAQ